MAERAAWIVDNGLARVIPPSRKLGTPPGAIILGEHDHMVWFEGQGCTCDCMAGSEHASGPPRCSHAVAAMLAWHSVLGGALGASDA